MRSKHSSTNGAHGRPAVSPRFSTGTRSSRHWDADDLDAARQHDSFEFTVVRGQTCDNDVVTIWAVLDLRRDPQWIAERLGA